MITEQLYEEIQSIVQDIKSKYYFRVYTRMLSNERNGRTDADEDWITVNGTHILLGEGGTVVGGPSALKDKKFSNAKSQQKQKKTETTSTPAVNNSEPTKHEISETCEKSMKSIDRREKKRSKLMLNYQNETGRDDSVSEEFGEDTLRTEEFVKLSNLSDSWSTEDKVLDAIYTRTQKATDLPFDVRAEDLNRKLYTGEDLTEDEQAIVDHFSRCAVPIGRDVSLYRMTGSDYLKSFLEEGSDDYESLVGREIQNQALLSTSAGMHCAFQSDEVCMKIKTPGDVAVCATRDVSEGEIVIPQGSVMRVTKVERVGKEGKSLPIWTGGRWYQMYGESATGQSGTNGPEKYGDVFRDFSNSFSGYERKAIYVEVELIGYGKK